MSDTGSPLDGHERDQDQGSVLPPSSYHVARSSTPGISSLDSTPRYFFTSPSLPRLRSASLPPPAMDMSVTFAYHLAPAPRESRHDVVNSAQAATKADVLLTLPQPQRLPQPSSPGAAIQELTETDTDRITPIREIVRLLRLQKDHQLRCRRAEDNLHRLQITAARTKRLVCAARSVQHTLAECIKAEDKASFANLLHAFHDASKGCSAPLSEVTAKDGCASQIPSHSFMDSISRTARTTILDLLYKIRYDGAFIADRLDSLSQKELGDLIPDRGASRQSDSVFGSSFRWNSRASKPLGFVVDARVDMVSSYSFGSALETLISGTWGLNTPSFLEHERSTNVWANVCARLIARQKPGSEKLVPAVLDIWAFANPWPARERFELWMLSTLQEGSFLLDQPSKQTFRARVEGRPEIPLEDALRAESFYAKAVDSLFGLLGEQSGSSLIPPGALMMARAIWETLADSPGHQSGFPQFVVTRWLCSSFLANALMSPEAHGSLTDHYVPELSRQRILHEIATRTQKAVYEVAYSWKHGSKASAEVTQRVSNVMALFQPLPSKRGLHNGEDYHGVRPSPSSPKVDHEYFMVISAKDAIASINALYPQRRPTSVSSDYGGTTSGLQSSASSISGFSLFRTTSATETHSDLCPPWASEAQAPLVSAQIVEPSDVQSLYEACLELEDFATNEASDSWATLVTAPSSVQVCTTQEHFSQITSVNGTTMEPHLPSTDVEPRIHDSCIHAVKMLLGRWEEITAGDTVEALAQEEQITHVWMQLKGLFESAMTDCEANADFVGAHFWFQQFQELREQVTRSKNMSALKSMFHGLRDTADRSRNLSILVQRTCEHWSRLLESFAQVRIEQLGLLADANERLRDKMWYVADVRTSAAYDETRSIAAALRIMGRPKRLSRQRTAPPLRHWSGSKLASTSLQLKSEAQILELLSARPEHGGPNKLSDEQSKITAAWLERQNIDNLCKGEERLHKFCMEVRKCVESILDSPTESSTISSNVLFVLDEYPWQGDPTQRKSNSLLGLSVHGGHARLLSLQSHLRSSDALSGSSRALSSASSRDCLDNRSPTLTSKSSIPLWSPAMTEADSPSSATSMGTSLRQSTMESFTHKRGGVLATKQRPVLERLRERLTGLLLSDLTSNMYSDGSETDVAFWTGLGLELADKHTCNMLRYQMSLGERTPTLPQPRPASPLTARFSFESVFSRLLQKFSRVCNPSVKLSCLYDIDRLLIPYMAEQEGTEHVAPSSSHKETSGEISVRGFRHLFSQTSLRPPTIFRDMQYIAALLPSSTLQDTTHGKAFCNAAVALAGLKRDVRGIMVETADSIIAYHSNNRGHGRSPSTAQQQRDSAIFTEPSRSSSAEDIARYGMADAAYLLQITAREGDHVAQRELATLYLTHPELMDRIVAPFARPMEVFREELEGRWRKKQDLDRCDPGTMCVAHHWMSLSTKGGDSLAKEYLRQREEMDSF